MLLAVLIAAALQKEALAEMNDVKVAMCQIISLDGDRGGNFVRIENALRQAKEGGAQIACFAEMVILGWVNPEAHQKAFAIPGQDSDRFCELAKKYQMYICAGLAEKDANDLYDSVILVDDKGQILIKHRKINLLAWLMTPPYTPGKDVNIAETPFGKIGLLICADTHINEILDRMASLKPDLLIVPYGYAAKENLWPGHGKNLHSVVIKSAKKTGAPVIGTNSVGAVTNGPWKGWVYGGQSVMVDRDGNVLAIAADREKDVRIITLKLAP
jgi:predicted amidohydrolase